MEEDIRILKEFISYKDKTNMPCHLIAISHERLCEAIEYIMVRNRELEYKLREKICIEGHEQVKQLYIPKSKVIEKIEELEKIRKSMEEYLLVSTNSLNIQAVDEKIMVLQELLED